jgi:hypothetical protein
MKLPTSVKIAGQRIKIKVGKLEEAYGQYEHEHRIIWISNTIKDERITTKPKRKQNNAIQ